MTSTKSLQEVVDQAVEKAMDRAHDASLWQFHSNRKIKNFGDCARCVKRATENG